MSICLQEIALTDTDGEPVSPSASAAQQKLKKESSKKGSIARAQEGGSLSIYIHVYVRNGQ